MLMRILFILLIALGLTPRANAPVRNPVSTRQAHAASQKNSEDFSVTFFPVAPHYAGDILSARVTYSGQEEIGGMEIAIALADQPGRTLDTAKFSRYSRQAIFYWVYDTQGHEPGFLQFLLEIPEMELAWETGVNLLPNPRSEPITWTKVHTNCCIIHTIPGTDAEEDILQIQAVLESRTADVLEQFSSQIDPGSEALDKPLTLALIPSVIGQGGFATEIAVITYSDRNWAGTDFAQIVHHELVHVLDRQLNDGPRPSLFAEGLAVYFSGGHYRPGDPLQRAAALVAIDRYIPITEFVDDFYAAQHEISYIEAAGLVAYLSELWGIEQFLDFYFTLPEHEHDSKSISSALEEQFGLTLAELEKQYLAALGKLNPSPEVQADVRLTIEAYETLRRYQKISVPSAYFRNAWWPPIDRALETGIAGDYAAREKSPVQVIIENLLLDVHPAMEDGDFQTAEESLAEIHYLLDLAEKHGMAFSHYSIGWPLHHPRFLRPGL